MAKVLAFFAAVVPVLQGRLFGVIALISVTGAIITGAIMLEANKAPDIYDILPNYPSIDESTIEIKSARLNEQHNFSMVVKNNNENDIQEIHLKIYAYDCQNPVKSTTNPGYTLIDLEKCDIIGLEYIEMMAHIPSGQVRQMSSHVSFSSMPPVLGLFHWSHEIMWIKGFKLVPKA